MRGRLTSYRFRRRLLWVVGTLLVATAAVIGAVMVGNTGKSIATPIDPNAPAWVYHPPPALSLSKQDRLALLNLSTRFVRTAVARKHLDAAWELLGPEMRSGQTRKSWDTGSNNVVPFDSIGIEGWDVAYAYRDDVAFDLALIGSPKGDWAGKTFTIELKRYRGRPQRWLVAAWYPKGVGGVHQIRSVAKLPPPPVLESPLSWKWLLVPAGIFVGMIVVLLAWALRSYIRQRRAVRRYQQLLGQRTSSSPS